MDALQCTFYIYVHRLGGTFSTFFLLSLTCFFLRLLFAFNRQSTALTKSQAQHTFFPFYPYSQAHTNNNMNTYTYLQPTYTLKRLYKVRMYGTQEYSTQTQYTLILYVQSYILHTYYTQYTTYIGSCNRTNFVYNRFEVHVTTFAAATVSASAN